MMQMCSSSHDEIVHDSRKCPLCEALSEIEDFVKSVAEQQEEINTLRDKIEELQDSYDDLYDAVKAVNPELII